MTRTVTSPRHHRHHLRRRIGLVGATAIVALTPALIAQAAPDAPPDVGLKVSKELQRLGSFGTPGEGALMDDSTCMSADPEPLTYSTREIILREKMTASEAVQRVNDAINLEGGVGQATSAKVIKLPKVPSAPGARTVEDEQLTPVIVVSVKPDGQDGEEVEIVKVARRLRSGGFEASPNYLMSPTADGPNGVWPNGYPEITEVETPPRGVTIGGGVDIYVYDVGLPLSGQADIPTNVEVLDDPFDDTEVLDDVKPFGKVDRYYAGHTVAMSDVLAILAPGATVTAVRVTNSRGLVTDASATIRMSNTLKAAGANPPDVIINSFGSPACDSAGGEMVPLGLEAITEVIDRRAQSVLVAASGNRSTDRQFYPGAFDTDPGADPDRDAVIGVGALEVMVDGDNPNDGMWVSPSRTGVLAEFSNYGTWVDAWAPGVGLPVRHIIGLKFLLKDDFPMNGRGFVDGTSFAAPYVAALIAEQISRTGQSPLDAWIEIEGTGVPCEVDGEDVGTAVALTSMGDLATTPPTVQEECTLP